MTGSDEEQLGHRELRNRQPADILGFGVLGLRSEGWGLWFGHVWTIFGGLFRFYPLALGFRDTINSISH